MISKFFSVVTGIICAALIWIACGSPDPKQQIIVKQPPVKERPYNCDGKAIGSEDNSLKCDAGYLGSITRTCTDKVDFA